MLPVSNKYMRDIIKEVLDASEEYQHSAPNIDKIFQNIDENVLEYAIHQACRTAAENAFNDVEEELL